MRRRDFLIGGAAATSWLLSSGALANRGKCAAVVIGVNKAGNLPKLSAAVSGARSVADWLKGAGFEVKLFVDESSPVKAAALFEAIDELVQRGTLDQLVVYFSGHGFLNAYAEYWMLSNAPQNPNEAVSLTESVVLAKETGIRSVVFISDACRSTPDSIGTSRVRGSLIFPNGDVSRNVRSEVDQFLAALPGSPALELPISQSAPAFEGIFTSCLLSAFQTPVSSLIKTVDGVRVITNRDLKSFLESEVVKQAERRSIKLQQKPDANIVSGDNTYLTPVADLGSLAGIPAPQWTINKFAAKTLQSAGAGPILNESLPTNAALPDPNDQCDPQDAFCIAIPSVGEFKRAQTRVVTANAAARRPSTTMSGHGEAELLVANTSFKQVETDGGVKAQILDPSRAVVLLRGKPAANVAVRFSDGSGTVVPAIRGFICSLAFDGIGVASVTYIRSRGPSDPNIDALHAAVTAAAQSGVFRIDGTRETAAQNARSFGDSIRVGKSADPTLGLYAAYAYSQADLIDQVRSVNDFMRSDLSIELFDVAMLSRERSGPALSEAKTVFPLFPMLSQGWNLLRVLQIQLPTALDEARNHLRPSLWTTFDPTGMDIVSTMVRQGNAG
ncbi:caspase family protein [Bradyrhizobium stylosanthis]|uniref:Caspase domain-containing protein n=1 Tax=Bradyrhizobium stylosanthis TaxID=1803665 RepID=A0A560D1U0_9BRAD|nr:caspase family protein [Bradyrhizobium stylosanthis]TWA91076.1 caspase domain-containing protein [Bradyrhizobium stylosanthis]